MQQHVYDREDESTKWILILCTSDTVDMKRKENAMKARGTLNSC